MKDDIDAGTAQCAKVLEKVRQPGRPRAIPPELETVVIDLYKIGYGYRAIAGIIKSDYHISADFSTIKRTLKRLGIMPHHGSVSKS